MVEQKKLVNQESMVTLAAVQFEPKIGCKEENVKRSIELINEAADKGANLIVLPELANTGYMFNTRQECFELCEKIPEGSTTQAWMKVAKERGVYIAAGIGEMSEDGTKLYNSAVLVGPDGYIGTHRKLHLWHDEMLFFEPGDLSYQVFHTPIGRIGMLVCYDMWHPESFRILGCMGADVICCSANWVDGVPVKLRTLGHLVSLINANCNSLFVVAADRIGTERGCPFVGMSCIAAPEAEFRSGPASTDQEEIIYATVNLMEARRLNWNDMNVVFRDRRTDVYDEMLGTGLPRQPR